jgi:hypothetical protein
MYLKLYCVSSKKRLLRVSSAYAFNGLWTATCLMQLASVSSCLLQIVSFKYTCPTDGQLSYPATDIWPHVIDRRRHPSRVEPHSTVYAASALPMEFSQNVHGQSALKVRHETILLHKCHTESTVAALKWIVLCNRVACPYSLVRNLLQQQRHKCGVARHKCGIARVVWNGAAWRVLNWTAENLYLGQVWLLFNLNSASSKPKRIVQCGWKIHPVFSKKDFTTYTEPCSVGDKSTQCFVVYHRLQCVCCRHPWEVVNYTAVAGSTGLSKL